MEEFDFIHRETVRFRDLDAKGHVNNAVYLTYMESARIAFVARASADELPFIIARIEIDFRSPVELGVRAARFGTKSFDLEYELRADGRLVAEAKSVCVGYDYESGETVPIPEAWREQLAA
jgi:acyl-CoA thioester hydrolase